MRLLLLTFLFLFSRGICAQNKVQPQLVLPIGHTDKIKSASFSLDGRRVFTTSWDNTSKIWDTDCGNLLHTFDGSDGVVSSDWKFLLTCNRDTTVNIWDPNNGLLLHKIIATSGYFTSNGWLVLYNYNNNSWQVWDVQSMKLLLNVQESTVDFTPDGHLMVTTLSCGMAKVWDAQSGGVLHTLKVDSCQIRFVSLCPNGRLLATASSSGKVKIWDIQTGKTLHTLNEYHTHTIIPISFSPDGHLLVTVNEDKNNIQTKLWDTASGALLHVFEGRFSKFSPDGCHVVTDSYNVTKLWDIWSGELTYSFLGNEPTFSPDGLKLVTNHLESYNGKVTAKLWDTKSGQLLHTFDCQTFDVNSVAFDYSGNMLVIATDGISARIWDTRSGELLHILNGQNSLVHSASFSPNCRILVTASADKKVRTWDIKEGKLLRTFTEHQYPINSADFNDDGRLLITTDDHRMYIREAESGILQYKLPQITGAERGIKTNFNKSSLGLTKYKLSSSGSFSSDGNYILRVVYRENSTICQIWDAQTKDFLHNLEQTSNICFAGFSQDGQFVVTAHDDFSIRKWDSHTGAMITASVGHTNGLSSVEFSPDLRFLVTASNDKTAKIWDSKSGLLLHNLIGHTSFVNSATFSPDGSRLVTASDDQTAKIWESKGGAILNTFLHNDRVNSAFFSPDGQQVIAICVRSVNIWNINTGKLDKSFSIKGELKDFDYTNKKAITLDHGLIHLYDIEAGVILYSLLAINSSDYLVLHPDGYYDGTEGARELLYFVCNSEIVDLAQLKDALYIPGLVEKIMSGQAINYLKLSKLDICDALPIVTRLDEKAYTYTIRPRRLPLERAEVYVNDKLIFSLPVNQLSVKDNSFELVLDEKELEKHLLVGELNKVKVIGVVNSENGSELRSRGIIVPVEKDSTRKVVPPRLFAVMIGINDYKDPALKLNFPVKDAQDLGSAIEAAAVKLLGRDNVFMYPVHSAVKPGTGFTTPEKAGIKRALEDIGKKARPEDIVFMFFAGHGEMQGADGKVFTFLTADASKYNPIGISTKELQDWLSYEGPHKMLANKTILIFDACNSGQATQELLTLARNDDDTRRTRQVEDLKDKSGMFILAGSAPNQSAYEMPSFQQGLLTYSLLSVLKSNPEVLDDGKYLNVQKWFLESERTLKKLIESQGLKQDAKPFGTANIRIGIVDEEVTGRISLAREKPMVICDNVLNMESFSDELQLKKLINSELSVLSERGSENALFFTKQDAPNANKINVSYEIKGNQVVCQIRLIKGVETRHSAMVSGPQSDLSRLVKKIIDEVLPHAR